MKSASTVYRKLIKLANGGVKGLKHGNTGKRPHNKFAPDKEKKIAELMAGKYSSLHPALAVKYLLKEEGIKVSEEYIRRLLNKFAGETKTGNVAKLHPLRRRRGAFGDLIQIDGSPHYWLGVDGPMFTLLVFVDDATGIITAARFFETETSVGYRTLIRDHIHRYGIPAAFYSDRSGVLTPACGKDDKTARSQYERVCSMVGIEPIFALSAQAKGRVERLNRTLQGRWPKELVMLGATDMASANALLPRLIAEYNEEFGRVPRDPEDAHLQVKTDELPDIDRKCALWITRRLSKNLTCSYQGKILQVTGVANRRNWMYKEVHVIDYDYADGRLEMSCNGILLDFKIHERNSPAIEREPVPPKAIDWALDPIMKIRRQLQAAKKEDK
ncbi:MAG: ISNCY family transposase [Burkholderiales bacterium]|nr:ISNCY family transposase [Burkholderiales bacterium]